MTLQLTGAALYGFESDNPSNSRGDADYIIPGDDFVLDISERGQELKDSGTITVDNHQGKYTGKITHGDRVEFFIEGPSVITYDPEMYGITRYGEASVSEGYAHRWTGLVRPISNNAGGGENYTLELSVEDYVYSILGSRNYYGAFTGDAIQNILKTAIQSEAPEIDVSEIESVGVNTNLKWNGGNLLELLREMIARGDAVCGAHGRKLIFKATESISSEFDTGPSERDYRGAKLESNDDKLVNRVRVAGGNDIELEEEVLQSGYTTATENTRLTTQITTRKSSLAEIEIWTRPTGSEEDITVRLQKDDGGSPVAINDSKSDIVKKTLSPEFVDDDGWTTFLMPAHTLPEPDPWLIVQSGGATGQDIGTDGAGNLAYRAHFPFPVSVELGSPSSQNSYRRRDERISDQSLNTFTAAEDTARGVLDRRKQPRKTVSFEAMTPRAHNLKIGEIVTLDDPMLGASGEWVVTQRDQNYSGPQIQTTITAHEVDSL